MKPRESARRKLLGEWLHKANEDLGVARRLMEDSPPYANAVAYHCQQATEKYLKGLLVWWEMPFPKTHDVKALLRLIQARDTQLAASLQDAVALTPYGVELRYPGDRTNASTEDAREALRLAERVQDAVQKVLPSA